MPATIMKLFKSSGFPLSVTCSAELQMASADVIFVLDTTGSMNCAPADGASCNTSVEQANSKISALKNAVKEFHKTIAKSVINKTETRIRYAFVPYSMTVNVKKLVTDGDMPLTWFQNSSQYQTKTAQFNTPVYPVSGTSTGSVTTQTYGSAITSSRCNSYGDNTYPNGSAGSPEAGGGPPPTSTTSTAYSFNSWTKTSGSGSNATGTCVRNKQVTTTTYSNTISRYKFSGWRFKQDTVSTTNFNAGTVQIVTGIDPSTASVPAASGGTTYYNMRDLAGIASTVGLTTSSTSWSGCIEERSTTQQLSMDPLPAGATDLDLNTTPNSDTNRWRFYWGDMVFDRGSSYPTSRDYSVNSSPPSHANEKCPAQIQLFKTADTTNPDVVPDWLDTYVNGLVAAGSTYHDLGMIWGGRIGSTRGPFATNVNLDNDKYPSVSRHIIFMTDGAMQPDTDVYSAYGLEEFDHRVAPSGTDNSELIPYHNNRFLAACRAAEAEGYTIWLVAFGQTITTTMLQCAGNNTGVDTDSDRAFYASDATALDNAFKYIAGQVADLRINK